MDTDYLDCADYLFRLCCAPAIFIRKMQEVFAYHIREEMVRKYSDDVILWGETYDILRKRFKIIFKLFLKRGIKFK